MNNTYPVFNKSRPRFSYSSDNLENIKHFFAFQSFKNDVCSNKSTSPASTITRKEIT